IALGLHNYADVHGALPPPKIYSGSSSRLNPGGRVLNTTGFVLMLAQLEQTAMYNAYNFSHCSSTSVGTVNTNVVGSPLVNTTVIGSKVSAFNCPSDMDPELVASYSSGTYYKVIDGRPSNYGFCSGWYTDYDNPGAQGYRPPTQYRGTFYCDLSTSISDVKDGTSNTTMIGETRQEHYSKSYTPYWGVGSHTAVHLACHPTYYSGKPYPAYVNYLPNAPYNTIPPSNTPGYNARRLQYAWAMGSMHPGGINVAFVDGSVHFIKNTINPNAWWAINTMNGQEIVGNNQF
ncbi:MAG TPA: DUF1559 domain-containing protein, partial [Isosphaeraceae bacterium]|nr:DUF1559 domain-containing protein [Isosphaeraceae bacterium]